MDGQGRAEEGKTPKRCPNKDNGKPREKSPLKSAFSIQRNEEAKFLRWRKVFISQAKSRGGKLGLKIVLGLLSHLFFLKKGEKKLRKRRKRMPPVRFFRG